MPQTIPYQNRYAEAMGSQNEMGQSISRMVLGLALERQRQQQQQFLNSMKVAEMQRQAYLDNAHVKLWGKQAESAEATTEMRKAQMQQFEGLSKLADSVHQSTWQNETAGTNLGEPSITNALRQSAAAQKAGLMAATVLKSSAAAQMLIPRGLGVGEVGANALGLMPGVVGQEKPQAPTRPFNIGRYGTIDPVTHESIAPAYTSPLDVKGADPTLAVQRVTGAMRDLQDLGLDTQGYTVRDGVTNAVPTAAYANMEQALPTLSAMVLEQAKKRQGGFTPDPIPGTNAPSALRKYKITPLP